MGIKNYRELNVWQKAMNFVELTYKITEKFPAKEQYRLTDQLCRAAISVPSNLAEGSSRRSTKEFIRFIRIAQGSIAEIETQLMIAVKLEYLDKKSFSEVFDFTNEISKMLYSLQNSLNKKIEVTNILDSKF